MKENKIKILIVEDDEVLIEMYKMKFNEEGFDVNVAKDGVSGLDCAEKDLPQIILLDIILPKLDGFALLEELKKGAKTKDVPVILLSNLGQDSDKEKGEKLGAIDYCVKSDFTPMQLVEKMRNYLKK